MARDRFTFLKSFADSLTELAKADENLAKDIAWKIINYGIYGEDVSSENSIANALFIQMKLVIDKGQDISEKRREANQKRTNIQQKLTNNEQKLTNNEQNGPKDKNKNIKDKNKNIKKENNIILKNDTDTEVSEYGNKGINDLIEILKQETNNMGIAYDNTKERYFAKFILTAKEYGNFCEKIGQDRVTFAVNVMKASLHINYWKGICSGPMKIYQNYSDVYNETLKYKNKNSKNFIQSF